jgi:hypothetical protein
MMRATLATLLFAPALALAAAAETVPVPKTEAKSEPTESRKDELVKLVVREAITVEKEDSARIAKLAEDGVLSARRAPPDKYEVFAAKVDEARIPDCLHPDGLKFQPPHIGPIGLAGVFAVPFLIAAKLRGKCN